MVALIQKETTVRLDWIRQRLGMGDRSHCCRTIRRTREVMEPRRAWIAATRKIQEMSINQRAIYLTQPAQDVVVCGVRGVSTHFG